jgi:hypothetical protein
MSLKNCGAGSHWNALREHSDSARDFGAISINRGLITKWVNKRHGVRLVFLVPAKKIKISSFYGFLFD